jgi:hypothetical protein
MFGVWPAPGARETRLKGGGGSPPTFSKGLPGPRGRPDPKNQPSGSGEFLFLLFEFTPVSGIRQANRVGSRPGSIPGRPRVPEHTERKGTIDIFSCFCLSFYTLGFLIHGCWAGRTSSIFVVWAAPAVSKPFQKVEGFAPHLWEWFLGPPGPPVPTKSTISSRPKKPCMKHPSVCVLCCLLLFSRDRWIYVVSQPGGPRPYSAARQAPSTPCDVPGQI